MAAPFRSAAAEVVVPATSANIGPGFDCFGLALQVHDHVVAMVTEDPGALVEVDGEGAGQLPNDDSHLVARAMAAAWEEMGIPAPGVLLRCANAIPQGRGAGSSAAAIVAGLLLARALTENGDAALDDDALLDLATRMEGHPDNVAAALLGGFTTAWLEETGSERVHARAVAHRVHDDVIPLVLVPEQSMSTTDARRMLPDDVARADAVFNVSRAALLVHALTADPDLLMVSTEDRLHQDARSLAYPSSHDLVVELRARGIPAVISGAGPAVLVLAGEDSAAHVLGSAPDGWRTLLARVDHEGARVRLLP